MVLWRFEHKMELCMGLSSIKRSANIAAVHLLGRRQTRHIISSGAFCIFLDFEILTHLQGQFAYFGLWNFYSSSGAVCIFRKFLASSQAFWWVICAGFWEASEDHLCLRKMSAFWQISELCRQTLIFPGLYVTLKISSWAQEDGNSYLDIPEKAPYPTLTSHVHVRIIIITLFKNSDDTTRYNSGS